MNERISGRQLRALVLTAGAAPVFSLTCSLGWAWAAAAGAAAWGILWLLFAFWPVDPPRPVRAAGAVLWFALAVWAGRMSAESFPDTARSAAAAALITGLAALAAGRGPAVLGRCAGILIWITAALFGVVLICGLTQMRTEWLRPSDCRPALRPAAVLLLPAAALPLRGRTEGGAGRGFGAVFGISTAAAAAAGAVIVGVLSPALAREPMAFLTLARSVSILGVIQRFEALISGALLMSGFCLCALLLSALREELLHLFGERDGRRCSLAAAALCAAAAWI